MIRAAVLVLLAATGTAAQQAPPSNTASQSAFRWTGTLSQGGLILGTAPAVTRTLMLDGKPVALSPDGRFIAGFDRDAGPQAILTATLADGRTITQPLTIAPRAWRIERLDTLPKFPAPDPVFAQLRPPELAQIVAARARATDAQGWRQAFAWPATGRISGLFGAQRIYKGDPGSYHSGTDIAKPTGAIVTAPADGVVILAADHPFTLEGNLLMLDHGMGLNSAFLHLSRIDVKPGDHVAKGQPIGAVGMTGRATGPHLHWALRWRDAKLDPMLVAGAMRP
ncbi:M23 family metallopeptidase [Sphingomonas sp. NFX23]|uniref:M23 family metallopeptidase n=1 Tax=Sphingomonas sp. NFX23 TaxID=2819532 RepID=UPI003CF5289F